MGKKKTSNKNSRQKNITVYAVLEGEKREHYFFKHLIDIYKPTENGIKIEYHNSEKEKGGGAPNKFVEVAIKEIHKRDRVFAWFDEDFEPHEPLNGKMRKELAKPDCWNIKEELLEAFLKCPIKDLQKEHNTKNKRPILIVSNPVCSESIILQTLSKELPYKKYEPTKRKTQIDGLKDKLDSLTNKNDLEYYKANLTKEALEEKRKEISVLDLLISMITKQ